MSNTPQDFGAFIRQRRIQLGLSANALGQKLRTSHSTVTKLESGGIQRPTPELLHKLARALGLDYEDLAPRAGYTVPGAVYLRAKEPLTPSEIEEVQRIMSYVLSKRQKKGGGDEPNTTDQVA